jgi:antitoxin component YwqK of YwqJK toxin-antitoxin module
MYEYYLTSKFGPHYKDLLAKPNWKYLNMEFKDNTFYLNGQIHSIMRDKFGSLMPARISKHIVEWYKHGKLHNEEKNINNRPQPAVICEGETNLYFINGQLHNEYKNSDGYVCSAVNVNAKDYEYVKHLLPEILHYTGANIHAFFRYGKLHNDDVSSDGYYFPAAYIKMIDGSNEIYIYAQNGLLGNLTVDGLTRPAFISSNRKVWYKNGLIHNEDTIHGVIQPAVIDGDTSEYYTNGILRE